MTESETVEISWSYNTLESLPVMEFYQLLKLRIDVFVVEQACVYAELDDADQSAGTLHVQGRLKDTDQLVACARIITEDSVSDLVKVGRVAVDKEWRGRGVARELMNDMLGHIEKNFNSSKVQLSAQTYVAGFYRDLGFGEVSGEYLEDGIPHVDMVLKK